MSRRGSVYKTRRGSWAFVVDVAPPGASKRVQKRGSDFRTKADAQAALDKILLEHRHGNYTPPVRFTFGEYLRQWLDGLEQSTYSPSTQVNYETAIRRYVLSHRISDVRLDRLSAHDLDGWIEDLMSKGSPLDGYKLSVSTIRGCFYNMSVALEQITGTLIPYNPARLAKRLPSSRKVRPPEPVVWDSEELARFLTAARAHELYPLFHLVAMTGIRRSEALALHWRDVDSESNKIWIRYSLTYARGKLHLGPTKTYRSERPVSLDPFTADVLRDHQGAQRRAMKLVGASYHDQDLVFAALDGGPLKPARVSERFSRCVASAGMNAVTVHGLRHTHATILLDTSVNPKVVQERLGHESAAFTMARYVHVLPGRDEEAARQFALGVFGDGDRRGIQTDE